MNGDETAEQRREAAGWLAIAREDVRVARACLALDPPAFGMAAYHCQQAAEKLTKGLLAAAGVAVRKTHDLNALADLAAAHYPGARHVLDVIRSFTAGFRLSLSDHRGQP
jgi:HEPN domain-containing protein